MRKKSLILGSLALVLALPACDLTSPTEDRNDVPNVPLTLNGRSVEVQGTITVGARSVTFLTWDSGRIDGDIISLFVNGREVLSYYQLTEVPKRIPVTLDYAGYNYVALYAHNEGDIPPNTAALSVDDGITEQQLILSADLATNGAYNIVVN